jgi:hypothetical protein
MTASFHLVPAIVMLFVSGVYYFFDFEETQHRVRILVSAHGALGALLYVVALFVWDVSPNHRPWAAWPYALLFLLPLASIVYSFVRFRGPKWLHVIQLANLWAFPYALFIGGMAITGDWL